MNIQLNLKNHDLEKARLTLAHEGHLRVSDEEMSAFLHHFFSAALRSPFIVDAYRVFLDSPK